VKHLLIAFRSCFDIVSPLKVKQLRKHLSWMLRKLSAKLFSV